MKEYIQIKVDESGIVPKKAHASDAGYDIYAPIDFKVPANGSVWVDTMIHMLIPDGYVGMLKSKSGLNVKYSLTSEGVIDAGYTGTIIAKIYNHSDKDYYFEAGDKITQIVILPIPDLDVCVVSDFDVETERGSNGFGSTGK